MDPLDKELLLRDLERYGYPLAHSQISSTSKVLERMLESNENRVLEGVPIVLCNMLIENEKLDLRGCEMELQKVNQKRFRILSAITYFFLFWVPESDNSREVLRHYLKNRDPEILKTVQKWMEERKEINIGGTKLDYERLEKTFRNYVVHQFMATEENFSKKLEAERQATFMKAMDLLFTEKQREVIFKLLSKAELSKTEREYFSRTIKPRLKAIRNADINSVAATLTGF